MQSVFAILAIGAAVAIAQNCPGTQQQPYSNCAAAQPCAQQGCQCMQLSKTKQGCCPVAAQPAPMPSMPQPSMCPGGGAPQSGCSANAGCPQQSNCQCTTLTSGSTGCCPTNFAAPATATAAPMVFQVSVCLSGAAPVCSCKQQSTCSQYNSQCQPLTSGGSGCCPPAAQPRPQPQPQQQITVTIQPLCQSGAAPVSQCGASNSCAQSNCGCQQLNTGAKGCCQQPAAPPAPMPQQQITVNIQPSLCQPSFRPPIMTGCASNTQCAALQSDCSCQRMDDGNTGCCPQMHYVEWVTPPMRAPTAICPQTNQAPISTGCSATSQCQAQQPNCACQQLNTGTMGCCQQPAPIAQPAPQPQQQITVTVTPACPQTGMAPISQGCSATSQCQSQQSNCACQQLNTGSMGCCPQPAPVAQPMPQQQITVTIASCPQTGMAPISQGCSATSQCQAQQSNCACQQLNTGSMGCCPQAAPVAQPAPQPQQQITVTVTPACPQTGMAPISQGCSATSQCQAQQSNCACQQLNTGSMGCCPQQARQPAPMPQQQITVTIATCPGTGMAPISQGCAATSQCQAQQSNCACQQLNTGSMGCCPQAAPAPRPQQQITVTVQATCPQTGAQPISQGCSATSQCQSQQSNCACQQLNTGSMGCCPQPAPIAQPRPQPQQQQQQQITVTVTATCPQTGMAPISQGCSATSQCQAQQSNCACQPLNTGSMGCCPQPQAQTQARQPQTQQMISVTIAICPQTGMAPISQGCAATSQCQAQQSNCACQQLNTGSMGCCPQPAPVAQPMPQQQITVTIQPLCSTGAAPISQGCSATSQCQAQQPNCACQQLNTGSMGCCPQAQPAPIAPRPQQQITITIGVCPGTGAQPISQGCSATSQCQAQQPNCACQQLNSGSMGCCPQAAPRPAPQPSFQVQISMCGNGARAQGKCQSSCSQNNCSCQQKQCCPQPTSQCPAACIAGNWCGNGLSCNSQTNMCCRVSVSFGK